jgi:hypothetical protein
MFAEAYPLSPTHKQTSGASGPEVTLGNLAHLTPVAPQQTVRLSDNKEACASTFQTGWEITPTIKYQL